MDYPEAHDEGQSAIVCLGMTARSAVPNEVWDASLMLGKTDGVGTRSRTK